ncbi:MAG: 30S ribosomal protein S8 [Candidatus Buchananbacteria bacterium]
MTDPIADMLTRIRNAQLVKKREVILPFSKVKLNIAQLLVREGFLTLAEKVDNGFGEIKLGLGYTENEPIIRSLKRISTPGRRVYVTKEELPNVLGGQGLAVISTSQGLMTNREAKKKGLGGELICEIY